MQISETLLTWQQMAQSGTSRFNKNCIICSKTWNEIKVLTNRDGQNRSSSHFYQNSGQFWITAVSHLRQVTRVLSITSVI
jgi:hypothetical protein